MIITHAAVKGLVVLIFSPVFVFVNCKYMKPNIMEKSALNASVFWVTLDIIDILQLVGQWKSAIDSQGPSFTHIIPISPAFFF